MEKTVKHLLNFEDIKSLYAIFQSIQGDLIVISPDRTLLWANNVSTSNQERDLKCYALLYQQNNPCPACPITKSLEDQKTVSAKVTLPSHCRTYLVDATPLNKGAHILVYHRDITELNNMAEIAGALPIGLIVTDDNLTVHFVNPAFFGIFPFIDAPITGKDLRLIVSRHLPPLPKELLDFLFALSARNSFSFLEIELPYPFQKYIEVLSCPTQNLTGCEFDKGRFIIFIDYTEEAAQKEHVHQHEAYIRIHTLFSSFYNEFAPSLTKIHSLASSVLEQKLCHPEGEEPLQQLQLESSRVINQLRELNASFIGKSPETPKKTNLHNLINKALRELSPLFSKYNIKTKISLTRHMKPFYANSKSLYLCLKALLKNAAEATMTQNTPRGKNITPLIEIETRMQKYDVELIIKDNGEGIESDKISDIFRPGYTSKSPAHHPGTGLFVCQSALQPLKGKIKISSLKGVGTKVVLTIPTLLFSTNQTKAEHSSSMNITRHHPAKQPKTGTMGIFGGKRVWILGENDATTDIIQKFLQKNGAIFKVVQTVESLKKSLMLEPYPSAFIMNVSHKKDSLYFLNVLREIECLHITILVVSEEVLPHFKGEWKGSGVRFIKKPFPMELLMEALTDIMF